MSIAAAPAPKLRDRDRYEWARTGDVNAFFGLMIDNIGDMILMTSLLVVAFGFPRDFILTRMIPGTAVGVLVGDLIFTVMAFALARRTGRSDVTAMPLGLDTPSTFGSVFLILGPAFVAAKGRGLDAAAAAEHAWFLGIAMLLASGLFKLACAPFCGWIRRVVPRAGLLGSLSAIALVLISFLPLLDVAAQPVAGFAALIVVLATLSARWKLPDRAPGMVCAVGVGCAIYYGMYLADLGPGAEGGRPESWLRFSLPFPMAGWWAWFQLHWREAAGYLPVAIPLALATIIGGVDCTESAAAVGDEYPTGLIVAAEGLATLVGGGLGGVIQSTPYIGHPAYKAMGARAAYTLATAVFIGAVGVLGCFDWIFFLLPKAVVFPILIFIGLEITAQSFQATPFRHFPAVAFACVPALAYLALLAVNQVLPLVDRPFDQLPSNVQHWIGSVTTLSGGFIVTSLLWGSGLATLIDGRVRATVAVLLLAAAFAWFGVIHSPLPSGAVMPPAAVVAELKALGRAEASAHQTPYYWSAAYLAMAAAVLVLARFAEMPEIEPDPHVAPTKAV
ncbi:permease [Paludisphaera mucosa]|uniref:Permease n=1 Tax=Paludisphaera mucosa TaxID=3030827 RepID=A0ABT6FDS9_9BACT|nr:permease [Paludisphaera mucosa]MDG3005548.1 permease [Paludisphaera mucosa]